jgi:7-cyano-7-deazaguanine synthase
MADERRGRPLSGGLDSTATLALAIAQDYEAVFCGQRHQIGSTLPASPSLGAKEHQSQRSIAHLRRLRVTDDVDAPEKRLNKSLRDSGAVPARNTFSAYALAWAEIIPAAHIFLGVNAIDYSGYPDCRPEFIQAFESLANLGTKAGVEGRRFHIHTPLIKFSKAEIIRKATELGVDLSITHSCYDPTPEGLACGECDSCVLRLKGFREAGITDAIRYAKK